jgi:hypothetical protein
MIPTLPIQVSCPQCGAKYSAQIRAIVDVAQDPSLKPLVLRGRLNAVACPSCKTPGVVSAPLVYHDPGHDLLLVYIPTELNMPMAERERLTGNLVSTLMASIPQEQRKGYFLNPRSVLTMQGLQEEILKADGITKEMIEQQQARARLLETLLAASGDDSRLRELVESNRNQIDYAFFVTLTGTAEAAGMSGRENVAENLLVLRAKLADMVKIALPEPLPPETTADALIDRLLATQNKEMRFAYVAYNRQLMPYEFFQALTARIDRASTEEADRLRSLRSDLLEMTEQLDKEARAVQESKIRMLQEILESPDPVAALRGKREQIDGLFLAILAAAVRAAKEHGNTEEAQALAAVHEAAMGLLQEELPPELRLVNELLAAEYPQGSQELFKAHRQELNSDFMQLLSQLAEDLKEQRPEVAQRLTELHKQAGSIIQGEPLSK